MNERKKLKPTRLALAQLRKLCLTLLAIQVKIKNRLEAILVRFIGIFE